MNFNLKAAGLIAALLLGSMAVASAQGARTDQAGIKAATGSQHASSRAGTTKHVMHSGTRRAAPMNARAQQADPNASPAYRPGL
jgi:hypothetical protein